jgi:predicted metalloprotease with PDZ domain
MALRWDYTLRRNGTRDGLRNLFAELLRLAHRVPGRLPEDSLFAVAERHGLDIRGDFERHILRGQQVALPGDAMGDNYDLSQVSVPTPFNPGFALQLSQRLARVTGVAAGGWTDSAGLRDGMDLVRVTNGNWVSPSWRPDRPIEVTVRSAQGERTIHLVPRGDPVSMPLFRRKRQMP